MLTALQNLGRETARIVLHASCVVCDGELPWKERKASCCAACWSSLAAIRGVKCDSCAMPWSAGGEGFRCLSCLDDPLPVGWTEAWGHYRGSLARLLHAFKFERHDFLDAPLAELLESTLRERGDLDFDAVVAVPMHRAKLRQRGYNQAELLARKLSRRIGIPYDGALLLKERDREPQSTLPRGERARNVRGLFAAGATAKGRAFLLVDDICTTGETLRACAGAIRKEGASRVCAIVVAKA
ncbi:MAG TPA: ComF family protein [Thermoanaerobaculia bacterium]|nr:ComF family protein [Thermoanaerobaculia bacterium]